MLCRGLVILVNTFINKDEDLIRKLCEYENMSFLTEVKHNIENNQISNRVSRKNGDLKKRDKNTMFMMALSLLSIILPHFFNILKE